GDEEEEEEGAWVGAWGGVRAFAGALVHRAARAVPVSETSVGALALFFAGLLPPAMTHLLFYPLYRLVFGTLYPAYASYKAVRTKNVKEYVKWMMYWIVFALFTCAETFTDVFLSFWFPFYYEIKIILVLWLLSPATKGSSILYRKFVHPMLSRREQEIDEYIAKAKEQGYTTVLHLGTKGVNYATSVIMQTAIKNLSLPSTVSSHSLLPASGGRVRTSSAPGDEPDINDEEEVKTTRRRSRSVTEGRLRTQRRAKEDPEMPSSEVEEEMNDVSQTIKEPIKVTAKSSRTKKTKKSKSTVTTKSVPQEVEISDVEM
ncbi:Receptor expression-enhancing protein, partial [Gryllus bimaculatus]